jgi:hypothetical protein
MNFDALPGGNLIERGLADLAAGRESVEALVVRVGAPRLRELGLSIPAGEPFPGHRLYLRLMADDPRRGYSRYNALLRRLSSFHRAARCAR